MTREAWKVLAVRKHARDTPEKYKVIAESNGHKWMDWHGMICCRDCGFLRRLEDNNPPCKGKVGIAPRS